MDIHDRRHVLHDLPNPSADIAGAYRTCDADKRLHQFYAGSDRQHHRHPAHSFCFISCLLFAHRKAVHESEVASPVWRSDCWLGRPDGVRGGRNKETVAIARKLKAVLIEGILYFIFILAEGSKVRTVSIVARPALAPDGGDRDRVWRRTCACRPGRRAGLSIRGASPIEGDRSS